MPEIFILVLMEFQWPSLQIYWKFLHIKWKKLNDVNHILMWLRLTGSLFLLITQFKKLKQNFITDKVFNFMYILLKFKKKKTTVEERREKKFTEHTVLEERRTNEQPQPADGSHYTWSVNTRMQDSLIRTCSSGLLPFKHGVGKKCTL